MVRAILDPTSMALLLLAWPLILNLLTIIKSKSKPSFYSISILSTACIAAIAILHGPESGSIRLGNWISFSLDRSSWMFVIVVYLCWSVTLLYSLGYISAHLSNQAEAFHKYMNATVALSVGAGLSDNFFTLLFFYIAAIPTIVPLIALRGGEVAHRAARFYVKSTLWPVLLIVLPVVAWNFPLGTPFEQISITDYGWSHGKASIILALIIVGLSKNCVVPFHLWLPTVSIAPAPVTAMIHSVASVQVGSIVLFKIAKYVYGMELLRELSDHFFETGWLIYLCGFTAIYTAYRAWKTPDLKERFSFSTVGQLSYIITAILVGTPQSMQGAMLHIITHSIAKLGLFFCAGAFLTSFGSVQAPQVANAIPGRRWLGVAGVLFGLSISGFPFFAGYYSKDIMLLEEIHRHHYSAAAFLLIGSFLNFVYIYPLIRATIRRATTATPAPAPLPFAMTAAIVTCVAFILTLSASAFVLMRFVSV
jgi:multicomponent Na+:H+ antiporter subunit D